MEVGVFEFEWILNLFAGLFNFFFGCSAFMNFSPGLINLSSDIAGYFEWAWVNPFNNVEYSAVVEINNLAKQLLISLPYPGDPLWYNVLAIMPFLFVAWFVLKGIIHAIKSVVL